MSSHDPYYDPNKNEFQNHIRSIIGPTLGHDLLAASDHKYNCRCESCLEWWRKMGPEERGQDGTLLFGPFTEAEIRGDNGHISKETWSYWHELYEPKNLVPDVDHDNPPRFGEPGWSEVDEEEYLTLLNEADDLDDDYDYSDENIIGGLFGNTDI